MLRTPFERLFAPFHLWLLLVMIGCGLMVPVRGALEISSAAPLKILFIGNSFTARHHLADLIKTMAAAGEPSVDLDVSSVIYGGRTLHDHWMLGSQNFITVEKLSSTEEEATIAGLKYFPEKDPLAAFAVVALKNHQQLLEHLEQRRTKWDVVVLQSYRDDLDGAASSFVEYAPKFAALAKKMGARVILYETTLNTMNSTALTNPPDEKAVDAKAQMLRELGAKIGADVVPMSSVAFVCQTERPDLTLRFVKDAHPNQIMAYLTACTFYGVLFHRSPVGLSTDTVTDTRFSDNAHQDQDRDGGPLSRKFSAAERRSLQEISWQGLQRFQRGNKTQEDPRSE